jgi:hypothetical protein
MTNGGEKPGSQKQVPLFERDGTTFSKIDAKIMLDGALQLSGHDIGELPEKFLGHDDYEYEVTVTAERKDHLLLALIADRFGGNACATSHFMKFLNSKEIPYHFDTWP